MVHVATLLATVLLLVISDATISTARLRAGSFFLIHEAEGAQALVRSVKSGNQKMEFSGKNRGKWVDSNGRVLTYESANFHLFRNGSVLMKYTRMADAGTYQKDPNPMIVIGDMGYAPPVLIIQVYN